MKKLMLSLMLFKISVYYGFKNNISPEELCKLDNLCITKRGINSSKGCK